MSLIDLIKKEDDKYITVSDFINLVANHTNDTSDIVIEYLCKFCLVDNDDVRIYIKGFANDYSNEFHLSDLLFKDDKKDDFRCYTMNELEKDDEFLISYFLRDEIFNAKYVKVLNLKTDNDELPATYFYKAKPSSTRVVLGEYQKLLITYSLFTPRQLACLIADYNPAYHQDDDFYNARLDMVKNAIEAKHLTPINDKKQIAAEEAQLWLIKCGLIYNGFNSGLMYDTLETYQAEHSKQQLIVAENKADDLNLINSSFMTGTPTVQQGEPKDSEQIISEFREQITQLTAENKKLNKQLNNAHIELEAAKTYQPSDDDKELAPNSQVKVTHMLYAILKEHRYDLSPPKGRGLTNDQIVAASRSHKSPVTRNFVANWLERVHQLDIDLNK